MNINGIDVDKFKKLCLPSTKTDCINWVGVIDEKSYGKFYLQLEKKQISAHRFAYVMATGENIEGIVIRHTCDNPTCVNPKHLIPGTNLENSLDARRRGLMHTKLHKSEVLEILSLKGKMSGEAIAQKFKVSRQTISHIFTGKTWGELANIEKEDLTLTKIKKCT